MTTGADQDDASGERGDCRTMLSTGAAHHAGFEIQVFPGGPVTASLRREEG